MMDKLDTEVRAEWTYEGNVLDIVAGGRALNARAEEIYAILFEQAAILRNLRIGRMNKPEGLSFSRYPAKLIAQIGKEGNRGDLVCRIFAEAGDERVEIGVGDSAPDHCLIGTRWWPLAAGAKQEVRALLASGGIEGPGEISLRQYLGLRKAGAGSPIFVDTTEQSPVHASFAIERSTEELISFRGNLYPYQESGWLWLSYMWREGLGAILADEMGLGKTIQLIALLASPEREEAAPSLVIAPSTVMENWRREILKFAPALKTQIHQGPARSGDYRTLLSTDIVITSYDTVVRDTSMFRMIDWQIVILDEAQAIKNPDTARAIAVKELKRRCGIAVTGTPVENRLRDLWSLCDFAIPGLLGDQASFEQRFADDRFGAAALEPLISPVMLRRRVSEVAKDLPERIDIPQVLSLSEDEGLQYEKLRLDTIAEYGPAGALVALTRLRMFCAHPLLLEDELPSITAALKFTKMQRLFEIVDEVFSAREKILVFTSYNRLGELIARIARERYGVMGDVINGDTQVTARQHVVDRFTEQTGSALLALNPRAAGAGLNITAATHVLHYNLEWNPAVEDQASARAHRRGQDRPVTIHRLYFGDSVEEAVNDRLARKRTLSEAAVVGVDGDAETIADVARALRMSPVGRQGR
jgi:SNF2 family DNA or RNA helicase